MRNSKDYANKVLQDAREVTITAFWEEYMKAIQKKLKSSTSYCTTSEDVRLYQGEVRALKSVLALPNNIVDEFKKLAK